MQIQGSKTVHEVIVIGSGASGGMAAWNLTRKGIPVLMLDAGTRFERSKFWSHVKPWEWRDRVEAGKHPPEFYVDTKEQPYVTDPKESFRARACMGTRRQDQRLGPRFATLLGCGFRGS